MRYIVILALSGLVAIVPVSGCQFLGSTQSEQQGVQASDASFGNAVKNATAAAEKAQNAKTWQQWRDIAQLWGTASQLMAQVPLTSKDYAIAQAKTKEYKGNQESALKRMASADLNESLGDALVTNSLGDVRQLLKLGANPRYSYSDIIGEPRTLLGSAAEFGSDEGVKILLNAGASWNQLDQKQLDRALIGASCQGYVFVVNELLKAGAKPNASNDQNETPLHLSRSGICRTVDAAGKPFPPGSRQHDAVEQALLAAGAR